MPAEERFSPEWDENTFSLLAYPSDPEISRDGRLIAYTLTRVDMKGNKYENTIVLDDLVTGARKFIDNASMARLSPSGKKLAFVRQVADGKTAELWVAFTDTTSARRLAEFKEVISLEWNQDDRRLLLAGTKRNDDEDYFYHDGIPYRFDKVGFTDSAKVVLSVHDSESGAKLEEIARDFILIPYWQIATWHGDGILLNAPRSENPYERIDILLYKNGKTETIFSDCAYNAIDSDGKRILLHGKEHAKTHTEHRYLHILEGGSVKPVTEQLVYDNLLGKLGEAGRVYFVSAREGRQTLEVVEPNGNPRILVSHDSWVTSFDVSLDGKVVLTMEKPEEPAEVYVFDGELKQYTNYNAEVLKRLSPSKANHFQYESFDGKKLDGWFIKPARMPEGNAKSPVVLMVHGGPKGMYGYNFNMTAQILAGRGYTIVYTNPRGSDGYDEEFASAVLLKTGLEDFKDIMSGLDSALARNHDADPKLIGITGISYGGYMTNWAITQSDRFRAAISENGISYWFTSYAFSDIGLWFDRELIGHEPLKDDNFRTLSPLFHAEKVNTPLLLIHSLEDYRCPLDQSLMFYNVLKDLGKEAYLLVFKKGAHGHSREGLPRHRAKRYKAIIEFFNQKLVEQSAGFKLVSEKQADETG